MDIRTTPSFADQEVVMSWLKEPIMNPMAWFWPPQPTETENIWQSFARDGLEKFEKNEVLQETIPDDCLYDEEMYDIDTYINKYMLSEKEEDASPVRCNFCMLTGYCLRKHDCGLAPPMKKDLIIQIKVPVGRSLLKSRVCGNVPQTPQLSMTNSSQQQPIQQQQQCRVNVKNLDSDGGSPRPDTPLSYSTGNETEDDDEAPIFRHDQINVHEKLSEYISEAAAAIKVAPASEVNDQRVTRHYVRRKEEDNQTLMKNWQAPMKTDVRNTLSDHCYHLNQPKSLEHLGIQTPSESEEEEIDVVSDVTFDKPCRQGAQPTYFNHTQQQMQLQQHQLQLQLQQQQQQQKQQQQHIQITMNTTMEKPVTRRPRGRPPSNPNRKKNAQVQSYQKTPVKRTREQTTQRKSKVPKYGSMSSATSSPKSSNSRAISEDETAEETNKRSLHNNMERQRRIGLRNLFEELRILVPAITLKDKAPKVTILRQARLYCDKLREANRVILNQQTQLERRQQKLKQRVSELRKSLVILR